jgi:hypothetical protein
VNERKRIITLIEESVGAGVREQLRSCGYDTGTVEVTAPAPSQERSFSASLGYTSSQVHGVLNVIGSARLWTGLYTAFVGQEPSLLLSPEALCDVAGELSNVAVGRLKRALLAEGIELGLAVPSGTSGIALRSETLGHKSEVQWLHIRTKDGVLSVCNSVIVDANITCCAPGDSGRPLAAEGALLLF